MIRRSFFQTLAAALLPQPVLAVRKAVQPGCAFRLDRMELVKTGRA